MSLAEDFLADLEGDADEELQELIPAEEDDDIAEVTEEAMPIVSYDRVTDVARLMESANYIKLTNDMNEQLKQDHIPTLMTPIEVDPQYVLLVALCELGADVEHEISVIHKFIRDKYEKRFPELENLVPMPLEYARTVAILGNDILEKSKDGDLFKDFLAPSTIMVVNLSSVNTKGVPLDESELKAVLEACAMVDALQSERIKMYQYIESRMALIAPNLCAIVGAATAAMLVSQAGGLGRLMNQPSCNLQILGKQKRALAGFSTASILPHAGFIYFHQRVQTLPPDYRNKATKIIAAKCTLAVRTDGLHHSPDGAVGRQLLEEVQKKIEKMLEPPPVKNQKALPKPIDKSSKKRGGRRVRKQKEMTGMTELRRKTNRINFGELQEDVSQEHMGFTLGQAASSSLAGGGRIRSNIVDNKTRVKMSQKMQRQLERQRQQLGGATSIRSKLTGTQSSISYTPLNGLEIVNPNRQQEQDSGKSTYFSASSSFMRV
uniref:U4/U6 small nuclear ribonucleoprotein Prp31 n=1 Tax=Panagrellus redivivus TaxID=6233 RepID=A0A7E4VU13_PANRE